MKKGILISLLIWLFTIFIFVTIIATVANASEVRYVASKNGVNLREKKSKRSDILIVVPYTEKVELVKEKNKWSKVKYSDYTGYIQTKYLWEYNPLDDYEYLGQWRVTAYAYTGSPCANGNFPTTGYTVACNSLPFGTQVYIKGVGFRTVEDIGPSYLGSEWLDLYLEDVNTCIQWGNQYIDVYLVG